ncbi:MAG TPA: MBL fold metallo-hydrolase [Bryobacteraceae bacterium]|nr:MBL fold metallo-hydrolase [Bryobacteraceae bacterium]
MKVTRTILLVLFAFAMGSTLYGQGPPGGPSAFDVDVTGYWTPALHEDGLERGNGPEIADYGGFALNEAGRLFALSYDPSRLTLRHHQCDAYIMPYQMRAVGNFRIWEDRDPHNQQLIAIHIWAQTTEGHRIIWMDGRPHPPAWAPHTYAGFSTGRFVGNALVIFTTHLKQGWLRRNGSPESDQATVTDFIIRHGDHLTDTTVLTDPVYLTEPEVRSNDYVRQPGDHHAWLYACDDGEQISGRAPDVVPHYPFGKQPFAKEYSERYKLPFVASLSGAESIYPGFGAKVKNATEADALAKLQPAPNQPSETSRAVDPEPNDGSIHVFPVRENVYMLVGDGGNIVVQTGDQGPFVVDSGQGKLSDMVIAAIRRLSPRPIQFIANTSMHAEHVGGNAKLGAAGSDPSLPGSFFDLQAPGGATGHLSDPAHHATLMAQNNVLVRLQAAKAPDEMISADTYLEERRRKFHNGELIELFYEPNAVTDGDSIVHFRRSDVIAAGDIFNTTQYPFIDVKNGGSVQGEIKALNDILDRTGYEHEEQGGTYIVPGHGYLSDEHEVVEYRDMVVIIRDRVEAMIKGGATLEQIKAARVTADYDTRYGANAGPWTTGMFVEAIYNSLRQPPAKTGVK